jgi:autotransporter translocation and assembly factor TamB
MGTSEILSLLLGGQAGLVSALIGTGLRKSLRIQELNVKNAGDVSQMVFGTYLGRNIYVRYFSNRIGQSEYNSIRTQYFIKDNVSIYGERVEENGETKFGVGVNLRFRF